METGIQTAEKSENTAKYVIREHIRKAIDYYVTDHASGRYVLDVNLLASAIEVAEKITRKEYNGYDNDGIKRTAKEKFYFFMSHARDFYHKINLTYDKQEIIEMAAKFAVIKD